VQVSAAGLVPRVNKDDADAGGGIGGSAMEDGGAFDAEKVFGRSVNGEMNMTTQFGVCAAEFALQHAEQPLTSGAYSMERAGVVLATGGVGPLDDIHQAYTTLEKSPRRLSPYFIPKTLTNMTGGHISLRYGTKGPLLSPSSACAASCHAVGDAYNYIRMGYADVMLAGGAEAAVNHLSIGGFARMKALSSSTVEDDPEKASRPFDADRNGFVIAEGACVVVLEEMEKAIARGAPIIAEVCGFGLSSDAHHITSPSPDGNGASRSMQMACDDAGIDPTEVGYINAHATSTPTGDEIEARAIATTFKSDNDRLAISQNLYVSSTKGATGHLLGAAGAIELAFTALAVRDGDLPPTLNLENPCTVTIGDGAAGVEEKEMGLPFQFVRGVSVKHPALSYAINNSFGFGGTNASVLLGKYPR
jgi:3-oxoacyl-[acyl-carrier-protein] synthase II